MYYTVVLTSLRHHWKKITMCKSGKFTSSLLHRPNRTQRVLAHATFLLPGFRNLIGLCTEMARGEKKKGSICIY